MAEAIAEMQSPKETHELLHFWTCPGVELLQLFNLTSILTSVLLGGNNIALCFHSLIF